jgi:hypothetical protein
MRKQIEVTDENLIILESGVVLQRLNKDFIWYAIKNNRIIDYSQYRNDLIQSYEK